MRKIKYTTTLLLLMASVLLQPSCDEILNFEDELCENGQCFSISSFGKSLEDRLGATTLGYSYAVYYNQSLQRWGQAGQARRSQDGTAFDTNAINVDMNVGSCAKSITTIAMLQALKAAGVSEEDFIINHLPSWWSVGAGVELVTFKDLVRHRSGFRPTSDAVNYVQIKNQIAAGLNTADHGQYQYQNMNFCILRILIPILDGTFDRNTVKSDSESEQLTTSQFMDYLDQNIFSPLTVEGSCNNGHDALYYSFSNPSGNGWNTGNECNNAGGGTLSLSANDLCKVMHYAITSDNLLSSDLRDLMFNSSVPLGCYSNNVNPTENWGGQFHHNGGFTDGAGRGGRACWYSFHNGVTVAVSTNSAGGISSNGYGDINDLIEQAFDSAWTP